MVSRDPRKVPAVGGSDDELDKLEEEIYKVGKKLKALKYEKKLLLKRREKEEKEKGLNSFIRTNKKGSI